MTDPFTLENDDLLRQELYAKKAQEQAIKDAAELQALKRKQIERGGPGKELANKLMDKNNPGHLAI